MAAEEDEGSSGDKKNDDLFYKQNGKPCSAMHQEIESKLSRSGISYEDKVGVVLSGWDHLTGAASSGQIQFATFLYRWTLQLVLQGEWPKLENIVKTRLRATLQRCTRDSTLFPLCSNLLPLVSDPWGHPTLKSIFASNHVSVEEAEQYIKAESWEIIRVRVNTLVESRCEELALSFLKVCIRYIRQQSKNEEELMFSQEDHNHFIDLYFVLLYKFNKKLFLDEIRQLDLEEGVDHVRRLVAQQEKGKVWKHRLKIAELEIQIFLASIIVKPYDNNFWSVFRDWCEVMIAVEIASDLLIQMVQKYLQLSESSQHVYTMASILHQKFGESYDALVIELLIRALTRDMNTLETIKLEVKEGTLERQTRLEHQMADGFMDLSAVFERHVDVARECVLTAFSLHPTLTRLDKLKEFSILSTVKKEPIDNDEIKQLGVENGADSVTSHTHENVEGSYKENENNCYPNNQSSDASCSNNPTNDMVDKIMKVPIIDTGQNLDRTLNDPKLKDCTSDVDEVLKYASAGPPNLDKSTDLECSKVDNLSNKENCKIMETGNMDCEINFASDIKPDCESASNGISRICSSVLNSEAYEKNSAKFDKIKDNFNEVVNPVVIEGNINEIIEFSEPCNNVLSNLNEDNKNHDNYGEANFSSSSNQIHFSDDATNSCGSDFYEDIKLKNDSLSMEDFFQTAELLIEQLNRDRIEKSEKEATKQLIRLDILSAPQEVLNCEELGLSKELCDDLAVVLSSPRWQVMSWALDKNELLLMCEKYFANFDSAKNVTKELKFLNIDYDLFKHLPSEEVDEFTGIEKGYEHFMEEESDLDDDYYLGPRSVCHQYSSGSEAECTKRVRGVGRVRGRRGRPPLRGRFLTSDSDSTGRSKSRSMPVTSLSESDDSDFGKFTCYKNDSKNFEGKRITAVSCNDRRKRLKIDATTGQVRQSRGSVNHLRLYRHDASCIAQPPKTFRNRRGRPPKFGSGQSRSFAPSLGSVNLNPSVVLTHCNQSPIKEEVKCIEGSETCKTKTEANNNLSSKISSSKPSILSRTPFQRGANHGSWRYAGYLVSGPEKDTTRQSSVSILPSQQQKSVKCSYRTREGRVVTLNTHNYIDEKDGSTTTKSYDYPQKLVNGNPSTTFQDSFAKFLLEKTPDAKRGNSQNLANRKNVSLESNLEYLKRQGTSVIFKKKTDSTSALENAQKNVLSRIMSPENSIHTFHRSPNLPLPVRAIAMPVSHNPPNLPPNDKTNPVGLSRVLPKGTTVVRRSKPDSGAGTSSLNNGGSSTSIISSGRSISSQQRPTISITPSNSFIVSCPSGSSFSGNTLSNFVRSATEASRTIEPIVNLSEGAGSSYPNNPSTSTENENFSPLAVATVVGSVSQTTNSRSIININSPGETQGGSYIVRDITLKPSRAVAFSNLSNLSRVTSGTTTTTVASYPGETRAPSMLETLLRDRPTPTSPILLSVSSSGSPAPTTTTSSIHVPLVASSAMTGTPLATSLSDGVNFITTHTSNFENNSNANSLMSATSVVRTSNFMDNSAMGAASVSNVRSSPIQGVTSMAIVGTSMPSNILTSSALSGNVIVSGVATNSSAGANCSGIFSGATLGSSVVTSNAVTDIPTSGMHQLLLPAQLFQVQQTDGSTGLSIVHSVHSGSLDLRLPPGTRVIKSPSTNIRQTPSIPISQPNARPLNVLHNVKIVQNRQIVRTVVVPHSVALQSLGSQQTAQLVALSQSPSTSISGGDSQSASKIPTQLHKMLGHNVVPGGLVIRAVRSTPDVVIDDTMISKPHNPTTIIHHTADNQQKTDKMKEAEKSKVMNPVQSQEEGLAERLSRHYLKTALLATSNTQSVGTQTQTTAVKPVTGQLVNQVVMNHLRGISSSGAVPIVTPIAVASSAPSPSPLSLGTVNAVSSETLEQLREFESVFEKVSNKSVKENDAVIDPESFTTTNVSSEESMIAAQLLSMANETPPVTTPSSYVYTVPTSGTENLSTTSSSSCNTTASTSTGLVGTCLGEGTFITIPCSTQPGTLILVNPSASASGIVTMSTASGVQTTQPPPAASPALSSTSSHSSIASSPSSTSSKSKSKTSKAKVSSLTSLAVSAKPKSPPPPKVPPKPAVAKPQVEESDETKARIQAILDRYKQDLANTPQPQPAPRNRKNCPPPKNEGKSSSKKKSSAKKLDSGASGSPSTSDSGHLPSISPSPAPLAMTPSGEDSEGSIGGTSTCSQLQDEKPKSEESLPPQILQGVVVSNVKVDGTGIGANITTLPQGLAGGRVVQFIRHGSKVTAITTRQPFQKAKSNLTSGGPPPNVTIQGRINMNDLMESHLATLLAGGSATINQNSPLITKLIQAQQQSPTVQQLVVQTTTAQGQQILQKVSLQSVIAAHAKQQLQVVTCRTNNEPSPSLSNSSIKTPQPHPSPSMSSSCISASPGTPQHRVSSPSTPSPVPDLPHTPSFPTHEEDSDSSVQSHEGGPAGPLPPFFTLTKQFMSPLQNQQFRDKSVSESASHSSVPASPESMRSSTKLINNSHASRTSSVNSSHTQSFDRSEITFSKNLCLSSGGSTSNKSSITANVLFPNSAPSSPLVNSLENVLDMSPVSEPSSIESSPSIISQRLPALNTVSELRCNSMDSIKSDLSVEEVQIPPSPATLTKQLQNAYMTEAALSPAVSQSHMSSSSSYSSPTTVQDLTFAGTSKDHRALSPNIGHPSHTYSLAGTSSNTSSLSNVSNCSANNNNHVIDNTSLACLSSPSGDVYLDQAGVGLGLDGLPLVEGRPQSPSLSDLVPAVPLLSWSPRSADSIMGQSPSLNDALTGNMTLDVHHSEDSLCDSSTGFPGLFSMEGDGASVSSSTSEDMHSSLLNSTGNFTQLQTSEGMSFPSVSSHSQLDNRLHHCLTGKKLPNHEQDQTISSTRCEDISSGLALQLMHPHSKINVDLAKKEESCSSIASEDELWRSTDRELPIPAESEDNGDEHSQHSNMKNKCTKPYHETKNQSKRRKSLRQMEVCVKKNISSASHMAHNGYDETIKEKKFDVKEEDETSYEKTLPVKIDSPLDGKEHAHCSLSVKCEIKDGEKPGVSDDHKHSQQENVTEDGSTHEGMSRQTRGMKRRSESDFNQDDKKCKSSKSRRSLPEHKQDDKLSAFDDGTAGPLTRSLRSRHISGTSDSSSNFSMDRISTPGLQDSPMGSGSSTVRKRRGSHDSSVSSRDSSPLTVLLNTQHDGSTTSSSGVHTRRSSSRDHAKKTRCRCCGDQQQSSQGGSSRRTSGRVSRGSGPSNS